MLSIGHPQTASAEDVRAYNQQGGITMPHRLFPVVTLTCCSCLLGADNKRPEGRYINEAIEVSAKLYHDKNSIRELLGSDFDGTIVVVDVAVSPKGDSPLKLYRDDFTLLSEKDGQKSQPFAPSQIAGEGALVISTTGRGGPVMMAEDRGPIWGGTIDRPRRLGGEGASAGNTGSTEVQATVQTGKGSKANPMLALLKEKVLQEGELEEPVQGLLYFPMEGKHKIKQLEMIYKGPAGKFAIRFKEPK